MENKDTVMNWKLKKLSPQFQVADIERTIDFYTRQLGFEVAFRYEDFYCGIGKDGYSVHFKLAEDVVDNMLVIKDDGDIDLHLLFSVAHIDELWSVIKEKPITVIQPLRDMPYGREFYITDPDGYRISFIEER